MKYMGSKNRYTKEILPIILKNRYDGQYYVEPFCGGCNIIDKIENPRIGNDIHYYFYSMFIALQNGWIPPKKVSEKRYMDVKKHMDWYNPAFIGYVGFNLSYGAKWFGGYRRDKAGKRNYSLEAYKNITKQIPKLNGIKFYNKQYYKLDIPENSIVYCDPPYKGTTSYNKNKIDYNKFWNWIRSLYSDGHIVYISEYNAPSDFKCIWEKKVNNTLEKNTDKKKGIERLFVHI